jgi:cytochrome oxidase assembly protein ShyY1
VLRTALKPKWLGLLAVVLVAGVACVQLGLWQLNVARDKGLAEALRKAHEARPVLLDTVVRPHQPFPNEQSNRAVTAVGEYAADDQFLVGPRRLDGTSGYWVVTPMVVAESGARVPVVRGFVAESGGKPVVPPIAPPTGTVSVDGTLAPGESTAAAPSGAPGWPKPALGSVDMAVLVNDWSGQVYNAFVFAQTEKSATGAGIRVPDDLTRVPPPEVTGGLKWRNAAYALQWWVFAGFALFMWFRMVRDDAERDDD